MNYLTWIKRQYQDHWFVASRSAPLDRPFINLAASGMTGGDGILARYPDHLRLDAPFGAGWRDGADMMWGHLGLREQIARLYGLPSPDHVLVTAGGSQALFLAFSALRHDLRHVTAPVATIETPTYAPLYEIPEYLGFRVLPLDAQSPLRALQSLHILSNPTNPTGTFLHPSELARVLAAVPSTARVLVDESFLSPADAYLSSTMLRDRRVITVGGLTKPLGLATLRIGWIVAHDAETVELLRDVWVQGFNIGSPLTESLAARVLGDIGQHQPAITERAAENLRIFNEEFVGPLTSRGLISCVPSARGCIAFPKILRLPPAAAVDFYNHLLTRHQLAVVPGQWFDPARSTIYAAHVRLSYSTEPGTLREGLSRLARAIEEIP